MPPRDVHTVLHQMAGLLTKTAPNLHCHRQVALKASNSAAGSQLALLTRGAAVLTSPPTEVLSVAVMEPAHSETLIHSRPDPVPSGPVGTESGDQRTAQQVPSTMRDALAVFAGSASPRLIVAGILSLLAWRARLPFSSADIAVTGCVAAFWVLQEYFLHAKALHSDFDWFGRAIHLKHHQMPFYHVSLDGPDLVLGMMVASFAVFWMLFGGSPQALTATSVYYTCGLVYEFTHYIVHTRVVPQTAWGRLIRDNHVKHHMRNEDFWFAFTTPALDRWMGTSPHPSDVKVSELARSTRGS